MRTPTSAKERLATALVVVSHAALKTRCLRAAQPWMPGLGGPVAHRRVAYVGTCWHLRVAVEHKSLGLRWVVGLVGTVSDAVAVHVQMCISAPGQLTPPAILAYLPPCLTFLSPRLASRHPI